MTTMSHDAELLMDFVEGVWTAVCSCGWESDKHNAVADAAEDWDNHCDTVFMEATES